MKGMKIKGTLLIAVLLITTLAIAIPVMAETTDISYGSVGDGTAGLSDLEAHSGSYSVKLYVLAGAADWAEVSIPVDIALKDINELNFWEMIESYNPNGWHVSVILGLDCDGDEVFEADVPAWHQRGDMPNPETLLAGDSFVEMEAKTALSQPLDWTLTDALIGAGAWWTPNEAGDGTASDIYCTFADLLTKIDAGTYDTNVPNTDVMVKCVKLLIGGSGSWMDEKAYVDDVTINGVIYPFELPGDPVDVTVDGDGSVTVPDANTAVLYNGADECTITVEDIEEAEVDEATFSAVGDYVDVKIDDPDAVDQLEIRVYYTEADIVGLIEANLRMYWYEAPNWRACSHTGVNMGEDYIWAVIRNEMHTEPTQPTLEELFGTPFGPGDSMTLDSDFYKKVDEITVDAGHGSANVDPIRIDTMEVDATSDTDLVGIVVELTETGVDTGIFTGSFLTTGELPPPVGYLAVDEGDKVYVKHDVEVTATIDETAPVFEGEPPVVGLPFYKNGDTITLTATLDADDYTVTADFSAIDSESTVEELAIGSYTITYDISEDNTMADGEYTITVTAKDEAGNSATSDFSTTLDNTEPSVTDAVADPTVIQPATPDDVSVTFTAGISEELSGVALVKIDLTEIIGSATQEMYDDGTNGDIKADDGIYTYEWTGTVALEGDYVLPITATDNIGNENALESITLQVIDDTEGPSDVSFTEAEPICGGLIVKGLTAEDPLSGLYEYHVYVDYVDETSEPILELTKEELMATDWLDGDDSFKGTFVLDLSASVGETVEVTVVAIDYATNEADPVTLYSGEVSDGMWTKVSLYEGWNLVSLPLIPDSSDSGDILSLILDQGVGGVVFSYGYDHVGDDWITNPAEMEDGYGYWLYMLEDDVMIVEGIQTLPAPLQPPTYEYSEGWVLGGYKQITTSLVSEYCDSFEFESYYEEIYTWLPSTQEWAQVDDIYPGEGFWIFMYSDQSLIPPLE